MRPTEKSDMTIRRKLRRGLALVLAVVLVAGLGLSYSADRVLRAEEIPAQEQAVSEAPAEKEPAPKKEEAAPKKEEPAKEEPAPAKEEPAKEAPAPSEEPAAQDSGSDNSGSSGGGSSQGDTASNAQAPDEPSNVVSEQELVLDVEPDVQTNAEDEKAEEDEIWTVSFYNRDAELYRKVEVKKGEAIGDKIPAVIAREDYAAYWAVGAIVKGGQGNEIRVTGRRINGSFKPDADTIIVPDYDQVTHTVTFYDSEGGSPIADGTRTVGPDTNYCLNDIPAVPAKDGHHGKWVYSGGSFSNHVAVTSDTAVWAVYDQNVFTVTFNVEGDTYSTDKYFAGDKLDLPEEPVIEGREFEGWYAGDTRYTGGETVESDLTINARFGEKFSVNFIVDKVSGETETLTQYFRNDGEKIGTMPQDPFVAGKVFEGWTDQASGEAITAETVVNRNITAVAKYREVGIYSIKAEYYYLNDSGEEVTFSTDLMQIEAHELPYTITAPATIQTDPNQVSGAPSYYPETPSVTVDKGDFKGNNATVRIKYVKNTAVYDVVYMLKDLDGEGYTEIERVSGVQGVLNSYVIPPVKAYDHYALEDAEAARITKASGQELRVLYTRKNVQLTYETNGGSYVSAVTAPYGSTVALPSVAPTREGFKFNGWFTDEGLSKKASGSVTLNGNTTLYAGWTGDKVEYTIVYMFEKYNDMGTSASFVYDNSKTATAAAGSTVKASDAPAITKNGWEKDTAKNASSTAVVAADGSTVLKVYYKLKEYTFTFNAGTYSSSNVTAVLTDKNVSGTGTLSYSMKVKLGQNIAADWPGNATGTYKSGGGFWSSGKTYTVYFNGWKPANINTRYVTKRTTVTEEMLPSSGSSVAYTAQWASSASTYTVNYWLQNADDDDYTNSDVYSQTYTSSSGNLSAKEISGYTYDHGNSGASNVTTYNFYYNRDKYKIDYYYGSDLLATRSDVKFDAHINKSPYTWTPTAEQCDVDSDYTFGGWYDNSSCQGEPYAFDTMPASNLVLYAKWNAPTYTINFVNADDNSQAAESQTVDKYKKAEKPANPVRSGYAFDGWYTSDEGTDLFDWNTQIMGDTTVYAHWGRRNLSYIVHYVDEEGKPVASDKEVTNPNLVAGQEITEMAIAIAGYRPKDVSQTFTMAEEENSVTFVYSAKAETTGYTVRYLINSEEYSGNIAAAPVKTVSDVPSDTSSVVEMAAAVDYSSLYAAHPELKGIEFYPDNVEKTLVLTSDAAQNVLTFTYSSFKHADVKLHFVDMDGNRISGDDVQVLKVGRTFTLGRAAIDGWELKKAVAGTKYDDATAAAEYKITDKTAESGLEFTLFYRKKATITALSAGKQYDGKALKLPEGRVKAEGLLDGHTLRSVAFEYSNADAEDGRLGAGITTVTPKDAIIDGPASEDYYAIRYISGELEVTQINVTIRVEPDRWTGAAYTGEVYKAGFTNPAKSVGDYVIISHEGYRSKYLNQVWDAIKAKAQHDESAAGLKYYGVAEKDAGDYTYGIDVTLADLPQDDNYSVSLYVRPGRLHILPKNVTVSTESAAKEYDGTALTNAGASITGLAAADEGKVKVTGTGSQTDIGTSNNAYDIDWGGVKESNYSIVNESLGTLTVTPGSVILTAASGSKVYDGKPLTAHAVTASGLPEGFSVEAEADGSITDAGTAVNKVKEGWVIKDASGKEVTAKFTVAETIDGTLTVSKAAATVTTGSAGKAYDGKALTQAEAGITGLVNGETATVTATGSQTEIGSSTNTYSIDWGKAKASNYALTENLGMLTVTDSDADVVITAASSSKTYDGTELKAPEVTASGLPEGFVLEAEAEGSITDAGSAVNAVKEGYVIRNAAGVDKTSNFKNIQTVNGTLTVNPKSVTITTGSAGKAYDGTALTNGEAGIDGLVNGETAAVTATGSQTEKGSSANSYRIDWGTAKSANYTVTEHLGTLTVTDNNAAVVLTAASAGKIYDGAELTAAEVTASGLPEGFSVRASATGSQKDAGSSLNIVNDNYVIVNAEGSDRTANFTNVTKTDGTLTVDKADLTVTTGSAGKEYDGTPLVNAQAEISGLVDGETATVTATGSQTDTGSSDNTFSVEWGTAKAGNYNLISDLGTLTVTENNAEVTLTAGSGSKEYDGKALEVAEVTAEGLPEGFTVSASAAGSRTDAGTADNIVEDGYIIRNASGEDRTASFANIKKAAGTLTVTPKAVTVMTGSAEKAYDGTALTCTEASINGLVAGETAAVVTNGTITEIGSSDNTYDITWDSANADNYTVSAQTGTLTVTENSSEVTLTAPSSSKVYDGTELTADGSGDNKVIAGGLPEGFTVEASASGSQTDAGESDNTVDDGFVIRNALGEDRTASFTNIRKVNGTLTVSPKAVTIVTGSGSKAYDGEALTNSEAWIEGLVEGETYAIEATGTITEKGDAQNTYSMTWAGDGNEFTAKEGNYAVTENLGTLTVTDSSADVVLTAASSSKTYDGMPLETAEVTASGLPEGFTVEATASGSQTDAGTGVNKVDAGYVIRNAAGEDRTANFKNIVTVDGTLTVNPKPVTISTGSGSKAYDGKALTNVEAVIDGLAAGETYGLTATGSVTEVGSARNTYELTWAGKGNDYTAKVDNYTVTDSLGILTVTANADPVTLTAASGSKDYDGKPLRAPEVTVSGLPDGFTAEAKASGRQTNTGSSSNTVDNGYVIRNAAGEDRTDSFTNINRVDGTLTVNPRKLTVTTSSAGKEYDGRALKNREAHLSGLAPGEIALVTATGSQTEVGSSSNTYEIRWVHGSLEGNYVIEEDLGMLTVTENTSEVTLTAASAARIYDGTELTDAGVTAAGLPDGFTAAATASGGQTDAGTGVNTVNDGYVIKNRDGEDRTANFINVKKVDGALTVNRRTLTLTSATAEKEYDGSALISSEITVGGDGFANGESAVYNVTGAQKEAGSSANTFSYVLGAGVKEENYTITKEEGTLTVTPVKGKVTVTITEHSGSGKYDGQPKTVTGYDVSIDNELYTSAGFMFSGNDSVSGTDAGSYPMEISADDFTNVDPNFTNTEFVIVDGTLEISKRAVTLTSATASAEYSGSGLFDHGIAVTGDGFVAGEGASFVVTGLQKLVGACLNAFTYTLNEGTKADNYDISTAFGTLTINSKPADAKYEATVTAKSGSAMYDGEAHSVSGLVGEASDGSVKVSAGGHEFTVSGLSASAEGTNAGSYTSAVIGEPKVTDEDGSDVTDQFAVKMVPGSLEITKRSVTLTSASATAEYSGSPLTKEEVKVSGDGFAKGEGASYSFTGSQTLTGISENTFGYTLGAGTLADNYNINTSYGTLTVTSRAVAYSITLEPNSMETKYDGTEKTVSGFKSLIFEIEGNTYTVEGVSAGVSATHAGTYPVAVTGTAVVRDAAGNDVSEQFTVTPGEGTLTIGKRAVTLTSASAEKMYDGSPLIKEEVTVSGDGFADGEGASYSFGGRQTITGESENTFTYALNEGVLGSDYDITTENGKLKVNDRPDGKKYEIAVTAEGGSAKYDGTEHSVGGLVGAAEDGSVKITAGGHEYTVSGLSAEASGTDAGTYEAKITGTVRITDEEGNDVTDQFDVSLIPGSLVIEKRSVILTSASATAEYSGSPLTAENVEVTGDGFVKGEGASYSFTGSQTLVGMSANAFEYTLNDGTSADNYEITKNEGMLTITSRSARYSITLEPNSLEAMYDGKDKEVSGFRSLEFDVEGNKYTVEGVSAGSSGKHAGTYPVTVTGTAVVRDARGNDVSDQFAVTPGEGTLTITKRGVEIASLSANKVYDGEALTREEVEINGDGFAAGEGAVYAFSGRQTIVGESDNTFTYTLNEGVLEGDYDISTANGKLTVTDRPEGDKFTVTVTANSGSTKYDGTEHSVSGLAGASEDGSVSVTAGGHAYKVSGLSAAAKGTNAGTYEAEVKGTAKVTDAEGNDVTDQFTVTTESGSLTIEKRSVVITSASATAEYSGIALTSEKAEVSGDGFADGEGAKYSFSGRQLTVGMSANTFEYTLNDGTLADNYEITTADGVLTVTSREVKYGLTLVPNSLEARYDGTDKEVSGFKALKFTVGGNDYSVEGVSAGLTARHAGEYSVNATGIPVVRDSEGNDVTAQFEVTAEQGRLSISRRKVSLTSADAEKVYDGTALTREEVTVGGDGFADGEGAAYSFTGRQTLAGTSGNTFTYTLNEGVSAADYDITTADGLLTVTSRDEGSKFPITLEAKSGSAVYDGEEHSVSGFTATEFTFGGVTYSVTGVTAEVSAVDAGTHTAKIVGTPVVRDSEGNDVTAQFDIALVPGTLVIAKRSVTLTSGSEAREYNGQALTNDSVTVGGEGFVEGEGAEFYVTGSQTLAGMSENAFTYKLTGGAKADNYEISTAFGQLTVTNRDAKYSIALEPNSLTGKYDGTDKTVSGFRTLEFNVDGNDYTVEGVTAGCTEKHAGTYPVVVTGTAVVRDAKGNDVSDQFAVTPGEASLRITKREVVITSRSADKVYDGEPLTREEVEISGDGFASGEGASYAFSGRQTTVGESRNTFTYTLNEGVLADDYDITATTGKLTVKSRPADDRYAVTITANSGSAKYDGSEHSVSGLAGASEDGSVIVTAGGHAYKVSGLSAEANGTNAGTYEAAVTGTAKVTDSEGNDVTDQFTVKKVPGSLVIEKRRIVITSASATAEYSGKALTSEKAEVSGDGFVDGEGASYTFSGRQLTAGMSANTFKYTLNDGTLADNYEITTSDGLLTVTSREAKYEITLEPNGLEAKYDGTDKEVSGFKSLEFKVDGNDYTVEGVTAGRTERHAGEYPVNVTGTPVVKDADGNDVTDQFKVTADQAMLTIGRRQISLTSPDAEKVYDGKVLSSEEVIVGGDGFAKGEGATYSFTGRQLLAGMSSNAFTYVLNEGVLASDYEISKTEGLLNITNRGADSKFSITLETNSGSALYDGEEHSVSGFKATEFTFGGVTYSVSGVEASVSAVDAGTHAVKISGTPVVTDSEGNDVTKQFNVALAPGSLVIAKRSVTLTSASATAEYSGKALKSEKVEVTGDGFVKGEGASYSFTGERTLVGMSENEFTYKLTGGAKADNYDISTAFGQLTVTNRDAKYSIVLEPNGLEEMYDGTNKEVSGFRSLEFNVDGSNYTVEGVSAGRSEKHAGTYPVTITGTAVVRDASGNDVSDQFAVTPGEASLNITKREVGIRSLNADKVYDGEPLTREEVNISGDGFASGEGAAYSFTGRQTVVGESENKFTYTLNEGVLADDYNITTANGKLTVSGRPDNDKFAVTITANSSTAKYDGSEHSVSGLAGASEDGSVIVSVGGRAYTVSGLSAAAKGTNAGTYEAEVKGTAKVTDADGNDVTDQFSVRKIPGRLAIEKRRVVITSASATAEYSGKALKSEKAEVSGDGFAEGEGAGYKFTGKQLIAGMSANTFEYTLNDGTLADNYEITTSDGMLTVTSREAKYEITLVPNSLKEKYDGTDKEVSGFESLEFKVDGNDYTVEGVSAGRTERHAGKYPVIATGTPVVKDSEGNDVTKQFKVTADQGMLTIGRRQVSLTSADAEKIYDGKALTSEKVTVGGDGFANGEGASYSFTGRQLLAGTSGNAFTYVLNEGVLASDYKITQTEGLLSVTDRSGDSRFEITLEANGGSALYDGEEHSVSGFAATEFTFGGVTYSVSGIEAGVSAVDAGTHTVKINGTPVVTDSDGNDVTKQFSVHVRGAALEIAKRSVTLTSDSASREYNGQALTNNKVTVSGDGFAKGEGAEYDVTGSRTLAGMSENTFSYRLTGGAKADNYDISTVFGQLTVTCRGAKYGIVLRPKSLTEKYDGTDKSVSGFESLNFMVDGSAYTVDNVEAGITAKNAGTYRINVKGDPRVLDAKGNDVTDQFEVTSATGSLTIEPRQITMASADDSKTYDGKTLRNSTVTVRGDGFAEGEGASYNVTGGRLLPGADKNSFTYTLNGNTLADNYRIITSFGTLTVTSRDAKYEIRVAAASGNELYDGTDKSVEGFETLNFTVGGNKYTVDGLSAGVTAKDAGEYTVPISGTAVVKDEAGNDVSGEFAVSMQPGRLVIAPRTVVMTSGSSTHAYNGKALTNDKVTVTGDGFAEGEGAAYEITGSRTTVGVSENTFGYKLNDGTLASNYEISKVYGTLSVTNRDAKYLLTLTPNGGTELYDGKEHSVSGFVSTTAVIDGETYEISGLTASASGTDAGTYAVSVTGTPVVTDAAGNDVTDQFSVVANEAALTITPRKVLLRSPDESREYDGTALKGSGKYSVEGDGFVGDDGVTVVPTASRTLVGVTENSFDWSFREGTLAGNYEVEVAYGLLSVVNRDAQYEIVMKANSDTVEYDGEEHSVSGFETSEFEVEGNQYAVENVDAVATGTEAGTYSTEIIGAAEVNDAEGNDVTDQFAVSYESGTLTITERPDEGSKTPGTPDGGGSADDNGGGDNGGNGGTAPADGGNGGGGEDITDNIVPHTIAPPGYWALANLIMAIISVLGGIYMIFRRVRNDDEDQDGEDGSGYAAMAGNGNEDKTERKSKRVPAVIAAVLLAIASVVAFILTEDMTNTMAFFDRYTILMAVLLAGTVISMIIGTKDEDEERRQSPEGPSK